MSGSDLFRNEASGSGKRHFYYNENWQCLEERVEVSGTINQYPIKQYTYFPHYIDAVSMVLYDPDTDGANITRYHYLHDANFNVVAMTDTSWNVKERYTYTPYGEVTILNGASDADGMVNEWSADTNGSDMANEFLYTGRRLDPGTGLYYYRNRYYHAQLGRFVTRDPTEYAAGTSLYRYVLSNPANLVDPLGLAPPATPTPWEDTGRVTCTRQEFDQITGGVFDSDEIDRGCIGLCSNIIGKVDQGDYPRFPENAPNTDCYLSEKDAVKATATKKCPNGQRPFVFAKQSVWKGGTPPQEASDGTVPPDSLDNRKGLYNYVCRFKNDTSIRYCWMNHHNRKPGQKVTFHDIPCSDATYPNEIWCVTCRCDLPNPAATPGTTPPAAPPTP